MRYGHDVELFLTDGKKGNIIPACGKIGGSKKKPIPIDNIVSVLEDNVALELNVQPADPYSFADHVVYHRRVLTEWLNRQGFGWKAGPVHTFSTEELSHPGAQVIGCSEDWDAFTKEGIRPPPNLSEFGNDRFTGGHVHISLPESKIPPYVYVRFIAAWVTLPLLAKGLDIQGKRRKIYGRPGLFRPAQYPNGESGIEYRAFSNFWFDNKYPRGLTPPMLIDPIFGHMQRLSEKELKAIHSSIPWGDVNNIILEENVKTASVLYEYLRTQYPNFDMGII